MKYFIGVDFGGGSSKATLIDEQGHIVATSSSAYPTTYAPDGTATQNPEDWYRSAVDNIRELLSHGISGDNVTCICFDAATHTAVALDENGVPLCDAIYWTDTRSIKEKELLLKEYKEEIFQKCKHLPDTIWTLPELMYLYKDEALLQQTKHILFAKDYVRHRFCPGYYTDYIEAQGSMMFDFERNKWDEHLVSLSRLPMTAMPGIRNPLDVIGYVNEEASKITGLSTKTKVICGCTDTAMEVFAAGAINKGDMTVKLATAGRICLITDKPYPDQNIINYSHVKQGLYYPGSGTKSCAASLKWFRLTFGGEYEEFNSLAEKIPLGSDGLFFHPYLNGELTPLANPNVRGSYIGVSSLHTKGHFIRALYEGIAFSLLDCYRYLQQKGLPIANKATIIGGGSKSAIWRQIVSDVLGIPLLVLENSDSSFGSALLAATSCGIFKDLDEAIRKTIHVVDEVTPSMENHAEYARLFEKYKEISSFLVKFYECK